MRTTRRTIGVAGLAMLAAAAGWVPATEAAEPAPAEPESALVALGRRLFHDPAVSRSGRHACVTCHAPESGWSDPRPLSEDETGTTRRHSQPLTDLTGTRVHWDGEFGSARELIVARIGDPGRAAEEARARATARTASAKRNAREDDLPPTYYGGDTFGRSPAAAVRIPDRLTTDARYRPAFGAAFGTDEIDSERIVEAVDAFVRSLRTETNAFDRHLAGEEGALTADAQRGLGLFRGKAGCASCHTLDRAGDGRALLSDGQYHNTGISFVPRKAEPEPLPESRRERAIERRIRRLLGSPSGPDGGRGDQTFAPADTAAFKTPSLRDVARRAPYMHDGSLATLEDVVRYYAKGGTPNAHLDPKVRKLDLSDADMADLVAFLRSLSGPRRAGLLPERVRAKRLEVRLVDPAGRPVRNVPFNVVPAGERLGEGPPAPVVRVTTDDRGLARFEFPQTTHVLLGCAEYEVAFDRAIPDTAADMDVLAARRDRICVTLRGVAPVETLRGTADPRILDLMLPGLAGDDLLLDTSELGGRLAASGSVFGTSMGGEPEQFEFRRVAVTPEGDCVFEAPLGKTTVPRYVRFDLGKGKSVAAPVDLSGGSSDPVSVRELVTFDGR